MATPATAEPRPSSADTVGVYRPRRPRASPLYRLLERHFRELCCGAQKWLCSPWGSGFAYVRAALARTLEPGAAGWLAQASSGDFSRFLDYDPAWHDDARRFEVGTIPYQDVVGMNATLSLFHEIGAAPMEAHVRALCDRIVEWALARSEVRLLTPPEPARRAGIVAFATRDVEGDSRRQPGRQVREPLPVPSGAISRAGERALTPPEPTGTFGGEKEIPMPNATRRCNVGILNASGSTPVAAEVINTMLGSPDPGGGKLPPPGVRMNGEYGSQATRPRIQTGRGRGRLPGRRSAARLHGAGSRSPGGGPD